MRIRRRLFLVFSLTFLAFVSVYVALSQASSTPAGNKPKSAPDSLTLDVPEGNSVEAVDRLDGVKYYKIYRSDGSLYATQKRDHGASKSTFFGTDPNDDSLIVTVFSTPRATTTVTEEPVVARSAHGISRNHRRLLPSSLKRSKASCGQDIRTYSGYRLSSTLKWWWNRASTPSNLNLDNTLNSLRMPRGEWEGNYNWCGIADNSSVDFSYQGVTTKTFGKNGVNTVGWGNLRNVGGECDPNGLACAWISSSGGNVIETDIRFSNASDIFWSNGGYEGYYDVWSTMVHETGHQLGLDDVHNLSNVMHFIGFPNDTTNRSLGKGDARGNNYLY